MKQSTLSRRIADLEFRLGVKLFERKTSGAQPTLMAKNVLEAARRIVTDVDNLIVTARAISYGESGRLSVGFSSALSGGNLRATISDYLTRFPDVQFDGVETDPERLMSALQLRALDVAVVAADLSDTGLRRVSLWPERVMVVLREDHELVTKDVIFWSDLKREILVVPRSGTGSSLAALLTARLTSQSLRPNLIIQDTSHDTIINMVGVGRFITIATDAMQGVLRPGLVFREVHDASGQAYLDFSLFWREDNENPALQHFFKLLKDRYPALDFG